MNAPTPENDYQIAQTSRVELSREVWNQVLTSIAERLREVEASAASIDSMRGEILEQSVDYIQSQIASQLVQLREDIELAQTQIDVIVVDGKSPDSQRLGGNLPSHYASAQALQAGLDSRVPTERKVAGKPLSADVSISAGDVGLGRVDNTSDADKPISGPQSMALAGKADLPALANLNVVVNGNMAVSQEHQNSPVTPTNYPADQWRLSGAFPAEAERSVYGPPGVPFSTRVVSVGTASDDTVDAVSLAQYVEAHRLQRFSYWESPQESTVAFFVRANTIGTYALSIMRDDNAQSFVAPIQVDEVDRWVVRNIHVPTPPSIAGWSEKGNHRELALRFMAGGGRVAPSPGWHQDSFRSLAGTTNLCAEVGREIRVGGVVWVPGRFTFTAGDLRRMQPHYAANLLDCQRYYWQGFTGDGRGYGARYSAGATNQHLQGPTHIFAAEMRVNPAMSILREPEYVNCEHESFAGYTNGFTQRLTFSDSQALYRAFGGIYVANARM